MQPLQEGIPTGGQWGPEGLPGPCWGYRAAGIAAAPEAGQHTAAGVVPASGVAGLVGCKPSEAERGWPGGRGEPSRQSSLAVEVRTRFG